MQLGINELGNMTIHEIMLTFNLICVKKTCISVAAGGSSQRTLWMNQSKNAFSLIPSVDGEIA